MPERFAYFFRCAHRRRLGSLGFVSEIRLPLGELARVDALQHLANRNVEMLGQSKIKRPLWTGF